MGLGLGLGLGVWREGRSAEGRVKRMGGRAEGQFCRALRPHLMAGPCSVSRSIDRIRRPPRPGGNR